MNYSAAVVAEKYFPANAKGSQTSVSVSATIPYTFGGIAGVNIVTDSKGRLMPFVSTGKGTGSGNIGMSGTTGPIYGKGFKSPIDFTGDSSMVTGSFGSPGSMVLDIWGSISNRGTGFAKVAEVWGYDAGISFGSAPVSLDGFEINAKPLKKNPVQLNGAGLLVCRITNQCGRTNMQ